MTLNQLESFISFVRAKFNGGTVRNCVIAVRNCVTLSGIVIFGCIAKYINYIKYKHMIQFIVCFYVWPVTCCIVEFDCKNIML